MLLVTFNFVKIVSCGDLSLIFVPLYQEDKMNDLHYKCLQLELCQ